MKIEKKLVSLVLAFTLVISMAVGSVSAKSFDDVSSGSWYGKAVDYATEKGLFSGTSDSTFSPDVAMTRGMLITVLGRLANVDLSLYDMVVFKDTYIGEYYSPYATWAYETGISTGSVIGGERYFKPNDNITRQDMIVLIYRYLEYMEVELEGAPAHVIFANYDDGTSISDYALNAMTWAVGNGIISGTSDTTLSPQGKATRAQVAQIFYNAKDILVAGEKDEAKDELEPDEAIKAVDDIINSTVENINDFGGGNADTVLMAMYQSFEFFHIDGTISNLEYNDEGMVTFELSDGTIEQIFIPTAFAETYSSSPSSALSVYSPNEKTSADSDIFIGEETAIEGEDLLILSNTNSSKTSGFFSCFSDSTIESLEKAAEERNFDVDTGSLTVENLRALKNYSASIIDVKSSIPSGQIYIPFESKNDYLKFLDDSQNYADRKAGRITITHAIVPQVDTDKETTDRVIFNFGTNLENYKIETVTGVSINTEKFFSYYYKSGSLKDKYIHLGYADSENNFDTFKSAGATIVTGFDGYVGAEQEEGILKAITEVLFKNETEEDNSFGGLVKEIEANGQDSVKRTVSYRNAGGYVGTSDVTSTFEVAYGSGYDKDTQLWKPLTVTFNMNGGLRVKEGKFFKDSSIEIYGNGEEDVKVSLPYGEKMPEPSEPTNYDVGLGEELDFLGWAQVDEGEDSTFWNFNTEIEEDITLYAVWKEQDAESEVPLDADFYYSGSILFEEPEGTFKYDFSVSAEKQELTGNYGYYKLTGSGSASSTHEETARGIRVYGYLYYTEIIYNEDGSIFAELEKDKSWGYMPLSAFFECGDSGSVTNEDLGLLQYYRNSSMGPIEIVFNKIVFSLDTPYTSNFKSPQYTVEIHYN